MDLYTASKRLSFPFLFHNEASIDKLPLSAHGLLGDGFSAALVRVDGTIDWLCLPRFDSPSVFGALLDEQCGGFSSIRPVVFPFESVQSYDPETNVLETLFRVEGQGVIRLTDYMPWANDPRLAVHEVHRRIECIDGEVDIDVVFNPQFDYGRVKTALRVEGSTVLASGGPDSHLAAVLSGESHWKNRANGGIRLHLRLKTGERRWMVISWNTVQAESAMSYRPFELLRQTRRHWRDWVRSLRYDGPWRHHVIRSALLLKLLIYAPTGAMVAAPTTALPEWIGGVRNWDYRYTWVRDTAMGIRAANLLGCHSEARDFFHFVRDTLEDDRHLQIMYTVDGGPVPDEQTLEHMKGYRGSAPVRIGNGAKDQHQFDIIGSLMDAAYVYERGGGSLTLRGWRRLQEVIEHVSTTWNKPDHGIWEPRAGKRHNVHSKLMSWLALCRGSELAPLFGDEAMLRRWREVASQVHRDICKNGLDSSGRHFVASYGQNVPDASLLLLPIHGFLSPHDTRVLHTVEWIRAELSDGHFVYRYREDDGVNGEEGAFVLCGFWLAEVLAMAGHIEEAQRVFVAHVEAANHLGLLAEEVNPRNGDPLGNFPQAFSHLGLINAAARIDIALRLRDEGSHQIPEVLIERYL